MAQPIGPLAVPLKYAARPEEGRLPMDYASALRLVALRRGIDRNLMLLSRLRASLKLIDGTESWTNDGPAWDQQSRDTTALTPQKYARLNRMSEDSGQPPIIHWPQWIRVRVGGELSYTKMLTGAAVERRANLTPLEDIGEEQIPGPPQVGGRYLLVCEQSLQLEREWRETRLIMEGEAPTPPLYTGPGSCLSTKWKVW